MKFTEKELNRNVISSCMIELPSHMKPELMTTIIAMRAKRFPSKRKKKERKAHGRTRKI